jgi:hypothetical protein
MANIDLVAEDQAIRTPMFALATSSTGYLAYPG